MKHFWHKSGICQYCGMCRRRARTENRRGVGDIKTYYTRRGAIWYKVPDCTYEWPDDWMPGMRTRFYKKPPAQQLNLFATN